MSEGSALHTSFSEHSSGLHLVADLPLLIQQAVDETGVARRTRESLGERFAAGVTRVVEICLAAVALVLLSPVMLIVAIIIRLDSPGPALFRQLRIGKNGHLFAFFKFRTLYADARQRFPELYSYQYTPAEIQELQFKREDDPRVTRAGCWLRRSTLDEIPNFWNLLKGDVAIVGPRPEIPEMLQYYPPEQMIKFSVKPGVTGLSQIKGRGRLKFQQTNAYDVEYVKQKNFWLDCKIALKTIKLVIRLDGAF